MQVSTTLNLVVLGIFAIAAALAPPARAEASGDGHSDAHKSAMTAMHREDNEVFPFGHPGDVHQVDRIIAVKATEFSFIPSTMTVKAGETVRFQVTNTGTVEHEFVLGTKREQIAHDKEMAEHPNMKMDDPNGVALPVGKTRSLVWKFTKPMTIQYACHMPGHYAAGMYGKLIIKPAVE